MFKRKEDISRPMQQGLQDLHRKQDKAVEGKSGCKPTHEMMQVSETDYRAIFNALYDAVFVHDLEGKIVDVNDKMLEIYRCTREETIGLSIVPDFTAPDNTMGDYQPVLWQKVMAGEDQFFEWKARRPSDGSTLDVEVALTKLPLPDGDFILASIHDITERKRVQGELTVTRNYLNTVFNKIHDAVFVHDLMGKIVDVNDKMLEIYRCTREEAVGLSIVPDFAAPDNTMGDYQPVLWQKVMVGEDQFFEWKARRPSDGSTLDVEVALTKLPLPEGDFILASVHDITERKRFERELTDTKCYLDTVFNNIHDAVFVNDVNGKVLDVNDKMLEMYQFTTRAEALKYMIIPDYTTPDGRPDFPAIWKRVLEGEDGTFECRGRRPKDGYEFDVEVFLTKLPLPDGNSILASVRDISARKKVERELTATKDYLNTVFNNIHDAVFIHDVDGKVIDVNDKMLDMYKSTREEAIGRLITVDYTSPDGRPDMPAIWKKVMSGEDQFLECKGRRPKDGYVFDVEVFLNKLSLPEGDFVLAVIREITERKRVEKELLATKDYLKTVFNNIHDAVFIHDINGKVIDVNKTMLDRYRCTREEAIGRLITVDYTVPDGRPDFSVIWKKVMSGEDQFLECKGRRPKDGYVFDVEVFLNKLSLPEGDFILASTRDITERKRMEELVFKEREVFFSVMKNNPHGIALFDDNDRFAYFNPEFTRITGYTIEDLPTIRDWARMAYRDPEYRERVAKFWKADRLQEGRGKDVEFRIDCKDGQYKDIEFRITYLGDRNLIVLTDVTARKKAEEELRAEKQRFQTISESSPVGMVMIGADDTFKYVNPKFKEIFGYDLIDIPNLRDWVTLAYPDPFYRDEVVSEWIALKSIEPGEGRPYTRKVMCKDGMMKHINFIPVQLGAGEILMTCEDITKSKEAEDRIRERNLELEVLNDIITSVSSSLHLPEILETLKNVFIDKLHIKTGGIFFYNEVTHRISMEMSWGVPFAMLHDFETFAVDSYGTGMVMQKSESTVVKSHVYPIQSNDSLSNEFRRIWQSSFCIPLEAKNEIQGMIFLIDKEFGKFQASQIAFFRTLGKQIGVATQNARLFEQVKQSHAQMKALSLKLVEVQEAERRYLARELHDEIGQQLTGLKFALEMNALQSAGETKAGLMNAQSMVNKLVAIVRELSLNLRPSMLDDLGLLLTLPWHFERFTSRMNIHVVFEHMGLSDKKFPLEMETAVFRIIQEALTNVARHAKVNEATVRLWSDEAVLGVQIEDHGVGFNPEAVLKTGNTSGLNGMRERAVLLGGHFTIEAHPGAGTRLSAEFPISSLQSGES
ncbi:MAG: PAS domain S-box protein [Proteobacteria bacterium]|nr:PAS domain S-box protein [Pseudomonadota bacterium]